MKHLTIATLACLWLVNCGDNGLLTDEQTSPDDKRYDKPVPCAGLSLTCSKPLPCKETDGIGNSDCSPVPDKKEICEWIAAESDPPQITGMCSSDDGESIVVPLNGYYSIKGTYHVRTDDPAKTDLKWTVNGYELTIILGATKGTTVKFRITYTGDGNIPKKTNNDQPKSTAECDAAGAEFKKIMTTIGAEPKTCETNSDCTGYGPSPEATCGGPAFTSKSSFEKHKTQFDVIFSNVQKHCEAPDAACGAAFPTTPFCTEQKICVGEL